MSERNTSLESAIQTLAEEKKYPTIREILITMNGADIYSILAELPDQMLPVLFRLLPKDLAAETFVEMDPDEQELLIRSFSDIELREVLDELYMDDTVDILEEMPANVVKRILKNSDAESRRIINEILNYPEDSAGSIMTTEYVTLRPQMTVAEAIKRIRRTGLDKETINTGYVTNDNRMLMGSVSIRTLLLADDDELVRDIMEDAPLYVRTLDDKEDVAKAFKKYDQLALPVVDEEARLVGIVTVDDAIDVLEEEATEDIAKMAAIIPSDKPYFKTGVLETWRSRIPWLLLLMISATFTSTILSTIENSLAGVAAVLILFVPMLMDTGGNSGSQASVTVIRGLSLEEIEFRDLPRVIWKEIRVAALCAVCLASVTFLKVLFIDRLLWRENGLLMAAIVCLTMAFTIVCAKIIGCTLPILAKKIHLDPAVMASPFITTIVDALSLLIYFGTAMWLLSFA